MHQARSHIWFDCLDAPKPSSTKPRILRLVYGCESESRCLCPFISILSYHSSPTILSFTYAIEKSVLSLNQHHDISIRVHGTWTFLGESVHNPRISCLFTLRNLFVLRMVISLCKMCLFFVAGSVLVSCMSSCGYHVCCGNKNLSSPQALPTIWTKTWDVFGGLWFHLSQVVCSRILPF